jgi:hypothetical protein
VWAAVSVLSTRPRRYDGCRVIPWLNYPRDTVREQGWFSNCETSNRYGADAKGAGHTSCTPPALSEPILSFVKGQRFSYAVEQGEIAAEFTRNGAFHGTLDMDAGSGTVPSDA